MPHIRSRRACCCLLLVALASVPAPAAGAVAARTAKFERVQHGMRDGDVSWGNGVHFDGVELEGSDGERMDIEKDKVVEDEVVSKRTGQVKKNYLAAKLGLGLQGGVETLANLPEVDRGGPHRKMPAADSTLGGGGGGGGGGGAAGARVTRHQSAAGGAPPSHALSRGRDAILNAVRAAASEASSEHRGGQHADARAAEKLLKAAQQEAEWEDFERKHEKEKQTHWGLNVGRAVWAAGAIILLLPCTSHARTRLLLLHPTSLPPTPPPPPHLPAACAHLCARPSHRPRLPPVLGRRQAEHRSAAAQHRDDVIRDCS